MIQKPERSRRFQQPATGQGHAITGVFWVIVHDFPGNFGEDQLGPELAAGKNSVANRCFADTNQPPEPVATPRSCPPDGLWGGGD